MTTRAQLARQIVGMAEAFGKNVTETGLRFYLDSLADLPIEDVNRAIVELAKSCRMMPTIAEIRAKANPAEAVTDEHRAVETANRIVEAISEFGWVDPAGAQAFLGDLGWKVVERDGGWLSVCTRTTNDDLPIIKAQWRELAKALMAMSKAGILDQPIGLPGNDKQKLLEEK